LLFNFNLRRHNKESKDTFILGGIEDVTLALEDSQAGAYTRPPSLLNVSTFCEISWLTSVCLWQKWLRLS